MTTVYSVADGRRFAAETTLVTVTCVACGMLYGIPEGLHESALRYRGDKPNGWKLHCPLGHEWWYVGETELERAKRERDEASRRARASRDLLEHEQRSHAATRGHLTRRKRQLDRVAAGVCPVCNRSFSALARHMQSKHPGAL